MITRDISLVACVLDLIDNCVDGATRAVDPSPQRRSKAPKPHPLSSGSSRYKGYKITISFSKTHFRIHDNCGGIPVDIACEYAFHFGRDPRKHTNADTEEGIGIYGIGMKRALFKLGRIIGIKSATDSDSFSMNVDVDDWATEETWDLELTPAKTGSSKAGTTIEVTHLNPGVAHEFENDAFKHRLISATARTYAAFLNQGLRIVIQSESVRPIDITFLKSKLFQPSHKKWKESVASPSPRSKKVDVDVELWAGAASAADNTRPDSDDDEDASAWGWYVLCNNRVVLAADKSDRTGWGMAAFPQWHPQYNGFIGIVSFRSDEPYVVPWTTTKNDVDVDSVIYRRARAKMQEASRDYIRYSRARKANPEKAKEFERAAGPVKPAEVSVTQSMKTPQVPRASQTWVNIIYQKPKREVAKVAAALGKSTMSATQVGSKTFDYYYSNNVD
jgi:hypothetical protein